MEITNRARRIVRLAAEQVKDPSTKSWLLADERGKWEQSAADYLEKTAAKAAGLGLSAAKVDEEIATVLALSALTSQLEHGKKRSRRR